MFFEFFLHTILADIMNQTPEKLYGENLSLTMSKCLLTVRLPSVTSSNTSNTRRQKYDEIMQEVKNEGEEGEEKVKRTLKRVERNEETEWRCEMKEAVNQTS